MRCAGCADNVVMMQQIVQSPQTDRTGVILPGREGQPPLPPPRLLFFPFGKGFALSPRLLLCFDMPFGMHDLALRIHVCTFVWCANADSSAVFFFFVWGNIYIYKNKKINPSTNTYTGRDRCTCLCLLQRCTMRSTSSQAACTLTARSVPAATPEPY